MTKKEFKAYEIWQRQGAYYDDACGGFYRDLIDLYRKNGGDDLLTTNEKILEYLLACDIDTRKKAIKAWGGYLNAMGQIQARKSLYHSLNIPVNMPPAPA